MNYLEILVIIWGGGSFYYFYFIRKGGEGSSDLMLSNMFKLYNLFTVKFFFS